MAVTTRNEHILSDHGHGDVDSPFNGSFSGQNEHTFIMWVSILLARVIMDYGNQCDIPLKVKTQPLM